MGLWQINPDGIMAQYDYLFDINEFYVFHITAGHPRAKPVRVLFHYIMNAGICACTSLPIYITPYYLTKI